MEIDATKTSPSGILRLLLEAQGELFSTCEKGASSPAWIQSLVIEDTSPSMLPLPYKARLNNLLQHLIAEHSNQEAKAGENYTEEIIERVKRDLRIHASTHPKIQPLVEILINHLPTFAKSTVLDHNHRPMIA